MDQAIVARIEDWEDRPFSAGYAGLSELAQSGFAGAVNVGSTWLFILNGRIIGIFDGTLSDFEQASGTAYKAIDPALVLLSAMQHQGGTVEAKYYTDDTPITEVDQTLSSGNFTGYIELSENVLSGDYYIAYYGGRSMSAAFVGNARRVVTGNEAFELINDEVGIYEVRSVDLSVTDIPEPSGASSTEEMDVEPEPSDPIPDSIYEEAESTEQPPPSPEPANGSVSTDEPASTPDETATPVDPPTQSVEPEMETTQTQEKDVFDDEAVWRESRTIPALDPNESVIETTSDTTQPKTTDSSSTPGTRQEWKEAKNSPATDFSEQQSQESAGVNPPTTNVSELEERIEELTAERNSLQKERNQLKEQLQNTQSEPQEATQPARNINREDVLTGTDLFVRYGSKGKATLDDAHNGAANQEDVNANLRLEDHTRFDATDVAVNGQPFREFLVNTVEYRFVQWLVQDFVYEIRETGNTRKLRDLFDLLPRIDRIEFRGTITSRDESGTEIRQSFDIVCRDRMGQPLVVADLNDSRDPATGEMLETLINSATAIAEAYSSLGAAFLVTSSFFQPDTLEMISDVTGGGLLNREKRKGFVKVSRKQGYHLCLVEAHEDDFHVSVPEL